MNTAGPADDRRRCPVCLAFVDRTRLDHIAGHMDKTRVSPCPGSFLDYDKAYDTTAPGDVVSFMCRCGHAPSSHTVVAYPRRRRPCTVCLHCGGNGRDCCVSPLRCRCENLDQTGGDR